MLLDQSWAHEGGEAMAKAFKLPDLGEGIHEGEILSIRVSVGDEVKEGDIIMEVETDKAAVEIPSPYTGMVEEILVKPGDTVKVGDVLVTFRTAEAEAPAPRAEEREVVRPEKEVAPPKPKKAEPARPEPGRPAAPPEIARKEGPVPASPATRRLARELDVDLSQVTPTGPGGLVTAEDVRTFAEKGPKPGEALPPEKQAGKRNRRKPAPLWFRLQSFPIFQNGGLWSGCLFDLSEKPPQNRWPLPGLRSPT